MNLIFCFPGKHFTKSFVESWSETLILCERNGIGVSMVTEYSADIYLCRNSIVGKGSDRSAEEPVVFGGRVYDYAVWIDSDMSWTFQDVMNIVGHGEHIVSGVCPIDFNRAALGYYATDDNGDHCLSYLSAARIDEVETDERGLIEVDFAGFAFLAVRYGVFEKLGYPWFRHVTMQHGNKTLGAGEDTGFCYRAQEEGFRIYADPRAKIGHDKHWMLYPWEMSNGRRAS